MHATEAYGTVELQLHSFLNSTLDEGEYSASCLDSLTRMEEHPGLFSEIKQTEKDDETQSLKNSYGLLCSPRIETLYSLFQPQSQSSENPIYILSTEEHINLSFQKKTFRTGENITVTHNSKCSNCFRSYRHSFTCINTENPGQREHNYCN